jgi:hypothetical protein
VTNFNICGKCDNGTYQPPKRREDDGEMEVLPSVLCKLTGDLLLMNSTPDPCCPYSMAHKISTQFVPESFAHHMSGGSSNEEDF